MKKSIKTILVLIPSLCLILGCSISYSNGEIYINGGEKISGNGEITTKTISTGGYDIIKATGFMDIHLKKGPEGRITVSTDDNLHEYITIEVKDNILFLKTKENINIETKTGVHITVPFKVISKVALTGSGNIETKDMISVSEFTASVTGSGDVDLAVEASKVQAMITGSGDITISGSTSNIEVNLSGSGDFNGFDIDSQNTSVSVSGSGDAEVVANESLVARVNGSGNIIYKGNPEKKDIKTSGSGNISSY